MKKTFSIAFALLINSFANSQCLINDIPLLEKINLAEYIFKGTVINEQVYFNENDGHIYTLYSIEIAGQYKNKISGKEVELAIRGGQWNNLIEVVTPSVNLEIGKEGFFFANTDNDPYLTNNESNLLTPAFGAASYIEKYTEKANEFSQHFNIPNDEYIDNEKLLPPVIESISPSTVAAGAGDVLTIGGSNFGDNPIGFALIQIRNPDFTENITVYHTLPPNHILSWSDTEIKIIVPGRDITFDTPGMGSGSIRVVNSSGEASTSSQKVSVKYNLFQDNMDDIYLTNQNSFGGYTFTTSELFSTDSDAMDAFTRALESWQCELHANMTIADVSTSTSCASQDGINLISFDDNCELPVTLLAQTTQWFSTCPNGEKTFLEMDILLNHDVKWNFKMDTPLADEYDFESLILHELGHVHGLGHVIDSFNIMYPSLVLGKERRLLNNNTLEGGETIINESLNLVGCGDPFELFPECISAINSTLDYSGKVFIFPNPVENTLNIGISENNTSTLSITVSDITGKKILTNDYSLNNGGGNISLNVSTLMSGIYVLNIRDKKNGSTFNYKIRKL